LSTPVCRLVEGRPDLEGILALQESNLERNLAADDAARDGFVFVRHDLATLEAMHAAHPSVVAVHDGRVVGYVIMMAPELRDLVPVLGPMFDVFDGLVHAGKPLTEQRYFVNGQVCVDRRFRGSGVFDEMLARYREAYEARFDLVVTEIARRNVRSLRAHERVGFRVIHSYVDPHNAECWDVVAWDWRENV